MKTETVLNKNKETEMENKSIFYFLYFLYYQH